MNLSDLEIKMKTAVDAFQKKMNGMRTDRASTELLDGVRVFVYGSLTPVSQVAIVTVSNSRTISISAYDKNNSSAIAKAIHESGLGLNPIVDGQRITIRLPELNQERRKEMVKIVGTFSENAKVEIRNIRQEGMKSENADREAIQRLTDKHVGLIASMGDSKKRELMKV